MRLEVWVLKFSCLIKKSKHTLMKILSRFLPFEHPLCGEIQIRNAGFCSLSRKLVKYKRYFIICRMRNLFSQNTCPFHGCFQLNRIFCMEKNYLLFKIIRQRRVFKRQKVVLLGKQRLLESNLYTCKRIARTCIRAFF